jgi:hypothetical protein
MVDDKPTGDKPSNVIDLSSARARREAARKVTDDVIRFKVEELFHDRDGVPWARVSVNGHHFCMPVESDELRDFIRREAWETAKETYGTEVIVPTPILKETIERMRAKAKWDGAQREVYLRTAEGPDGASIYLDLGDETHRAIRIDPNGWALVENPPVYFRRSVGMQSLPIPKRGGNIDELRSFVNIKASDFPLIVAWLLAALRPRGPYPVLILEGPTGSAKSTLARILRHFVDPDSVPLRSPPRGLDDLNVEARYSHALVFDNFSRINQALSDALCRLATGGGSVQRQFFTKTGQVRFNAIRPVTLNGIPDLLEQPDLQGRSIVLIAPRLVTKKTEARLFAELDAASGRIFGALLDLMVTGLRNLPDTVLTEDLRMAEFAT